MADPRQVATPVPPWSPCSVEGRAGRLSGKVASWGENRPSGWPGGCPPEATAFPPNACAESRDPSRPASRSTRWCGPPPPESGTRAAAGLLAAGGAGTAAHQPQAHNCLRMLQSGALLSLPGAAWSSSPAPCRQPSSPHSPGLSKPLDQGGRQALDENSPTVSCRILAGGPNPPGPPPWALGEPSSECSSLRADQLSCQPRKLGLGVEGAAARERGPLLPPPPPWRSPLPPAQRQAPST